MCCAARASCSSGMGGGKGTGPPGAPSPSGLGGHKTAAPPWPCHDILAPEALECHRKPDSSEAYMSQACTGASHGPGKAAAADQSVLPALEETHPQSRSSSHAAPGRIPPSRWEQAAGQATLSPQSHSLSDPGVLIMTGDLQPHPHTPGPARPVPAPGRAERASVQLPASASPSSKASKYKQGHSVTCPRGPGACDRPPGCCKPAV